MVSCGFFVQGNVVHMTTPHPTRPGFRPDPLVSAPRRPTQAGSATPAAPAARPNPTPPSAGGAASSGTHPEFEELQARHAQLRDQRSRLEVLTEQANKEIEQCQRQAKALGIDSLEALQERIAALRAQDAESVENFRQQLVQEERLQAEAFRHLEEVDQEQG